MAELNPSVFVVSTNGRTAQYTYCPDQADACPGLSGATKSKALRSCREESGVACEVYAVGRRVVWKGTVAPSPSTVKATDEDVCRGALVTKPSSHGEAPLWEDKDLYRDDVNEAKRRDLTPEKCAALLGREATE